MENIKKAGFAVILMGALLSLYLFISFLLKDGVVGSPLTGFLITALMLWQLPFYFGVFLLIKESEVMERAVITTASASIVTFLHVNLLKAAFPAFPHPISLVNWLLLPILGFILFNFLTFLSIQIFMIITGKNKRTN